MLQNVSHDNGAFKIWTPFKRRRVNQWVHNNEIYEITDIIALLEEMENTLFETMQGITSICKLKTKKFTINGLIDLN